MHVLGYIEVKPRIVDEYHHVGLPLQDVLLAHLHVAQDGGQVQQYGDKTHICQLAVVLDHRTAYSSHQVAAEEAELRLSVALLQTLHQVRRMKVAAGLTGY